MSWLQRLLRRRHSEPDVSLHRVQEKFRQFRSLLDRHDQAMRAISDMEEKSHGDYLFDLNYIRSSLNNIKSWMVEAVELMVALGGDSYTPLRRRLETTFSEIEQILPLSSTIEKDTLTIPFEALSRDRARSVGSKNAQLGEMKTKLGLPVPEGFAISAWAYKRFLDSGNLQERIGERINSLNIKRHDDLVACSEEIRDSILSHRVPEDIVAAAKSSLAELTDRYPAKRFAMRSSAIGEDTLFSFAGQYASLLNVPPRGLIDAYREVLASKFTPQAIYYYLSHALKGSGLAMSVGCVAMIDPVSAGVVYSRSPVDPDDDCVVISSIWGLGKYLVDGRLTPDTFWISRGDKTIVNQTIARKMVRLVPDLERGTIEEDVPEADQTKPSVTTEQLCQLAIYALKLEEHYGSPQDVEWAVDREGQIFLLQTRPLQIARVSQNQMNVDTVKLKRLINNGTTVSPGIGSGRVCHVSSVEDLADVGVGTVLVTPNSFPGIVTVMTKVNAIVTEVGGVANHMATIAREYRVPTLGNVRSAHQLPAGEEVTVDASHGVVYAGAQRDLIKVRKAEYELFSDMVIINTLRKLLESISPLNLLHPRASAFRVDNCETIHDICRFIHQKGIEEMFRAATGLGKSRGGLRLITDMPLEVRLIYLDRENATMGGRGQLGVDQLDSIPMEAFWKGIAQEGWPASSPSPDLARVEGAVSDDDDRNPRYRKTSFAMLSHEYMICNLHMGYHFTTVEAMCTDDPDRNYCRVQWGEGGAQLNKRVRRISLIADVAKRLGFENYSHADFLDVLLSYLPREDMCERLTLLGRLTMMTKQLDMALSNDDIALWYKKDIMKRLGLSSDEGSDA
ncbi:MAG: hypothetical protein KOO62_13255 [candidate division Zixibacteria bacterium]|nr:hypothetical protein [candidate division Zixibacteria bacterium]